MESRPRSDDGRLRRHRSGAASRLRPARRAHARRAGLSGGRPAAGHVRLRASTRRGRRSRTTACSWFGSGGNVDNQIQAIFNSGTALAEPVYTFHAWPLIWGTILLVGGAVTIAFVCSLFVAVFIVEFAPDPMRRVLEPVVRLLASVPSVHLRAGRGVRAGAVHRQPPDHPGQQGLGRRGSSRSTATAFWPAC